VISERKSFSHPTNGIFCEIPYVYGVPQAFTTISLWAAPPGGSKGSVNWASCPPTVVDANRRVGRKPRYGLWRHSPFVHTWGAAFQLGLPLGAPVGFGGLGHPRFCNASRGYHFKWLTTLSSMSIVDVALGSGLSILPTPSSAFRAAGKRWLEEILASDKEMQSLKELYPDLASELPPNAVGESALLPSGRLALSLSDAVEEALTKVMSWEFYFRTPDDLPFHAPSVRTAVRKFVSKLEKAPPIAGRYSRVKKDWGQKQARFLSPNTIPVAASTWSVLRQSCKPRSPVGLVKQPETKRKCGKPSRTRCLA
jgi:hypothetical protein